MIYIDGDDCDPKLAENLKYLLPLLKNPGDVQIYTSAANKDKWKSTDDAKVIETKDVVTSISFYAASECVSKKKSVILIGKKEKFASLADLLYNERQCQLVCLPPDGLPWFGRGEETTAEADKDVYVYIDGDNISYRCMGKVLYAANKYGKIKFVKVYGNPNGENGWIKAAKELNAEFSYTSAKGKNAADKEMILAAQKDLAKKVPAAVLIASCDSDFSDFVKKAKEKTTVVGAVRNNSRVKYRQLFHKCYIV